MRLLVRRTILAIAAAAVLGAAVLLWPRQEERPSLLLVTVDTLRADRLGCYDRRSTLTPNIDRFASGATVYENAACPMPLTRPSHFTMMTSMHPRAHGVLNNQTPLPESAVTLPELLQRAGYATGAFVAVKLMDRAAGAAQGFDLFAAPSLTQTLAAEQVVTQAAAWMAQTVESGRPFFAWVHLFDPHMPYAPPAPFQPAATGPAAFDAATWPGLAEQAAQGGGDLSAVVLARALDLYGGEVAYTDHWTGRLLDSLDASGIAERTAVVFTADHGECFDHGIYFEHSDCLYDGAVRVPLIVRYPGGTRAGARVREQVDLLDVAPTLVELAGIARPATFTGRALGEASEEPTGRPAFFQHPFYSADSVRNRVDRQAAFKSVAGAPLRPLEVGAEITGLRTERWKYVSFGAREELYDLQADPGELDNLIERQPGLARQLRGSVRGWLAATPLNLPGHVPINDELRETLRALGYVR
jgi:arylsulfatase A-like enzyme